MVCGKLGRGAGARIPIITRQRKVAHKHVDAVIEVAVDVVDELVIIRKEPRQPSRV